MAEVNTHSGSFARRIREALRAGLAEGGIEARVETQKVRTTRLHRVIVSAPQFEQLRPSERQDLAWRIIDQRFSPDEQLLISMILTLTPDELEGG